MVLPSLDCALHAVSVVRAQFCLSHHFSVDVPLMPYCPRAEDIRRKARFQALATGLALTMALWVHCIARKRRLTTHCTITRFTTVPLLHQTVEASCVLQKPHTPPLFLLNCAGPDLRHVSSIHHRSIIRQLVRPFMAFRDTSFEKRHFLLLLLRTVFLLDKFCATCLRSKPTNRHPSLLGTEDKLGSSSATDVMCSCVSHAVTDDSIQDKLGSRSANDVIFMYLSRSGRSRSDQDALRTSWDPAPPQMS